MLVRRATGPTFRVAHVLGALFALAPRTFYGAHAGAAHDPVDLHVGGAVMLVVGG